MNFSTIVRSLAWSGVESWGVSVLLLLTAIVLARVLGPEEFGVASLVISIVFIFSFAVERLFHDAIIQRPELSEDHVNSAFTASLVVSLCLFVVMWLIAPAFSNLYSNPQLTPILRLASFSIVFAGSSGVLMALLRRQMLFKVLAVRNVVGGLAGAAVGIALALSGFGVWSLIAQHVVHAFGAMVAVFVSVDKLPALRLSRARLQDLFGFSSAVLMTNLIGSSSFRLFLGIVGYLSGVAAVGYLEIASRVVDTLRNLWLSAVNPVALSAFSRIQQSRDELGRAFLTATEINASMAVPIFAGIFVTADKFVPVVLGPQWTPSVIVIQILAIGNLVGLVRLFAPVALNATGHPRYNLLSAIIASTASNLGVLLFSPSGLAVIALFWVARVLFTFPLGMWWIWRVLGLSAYEQTTGAAAPLFAASVMVGALFLTETYLISDLGPGAQLATALVLGPLIYFPLLLLTAPHLIQNIVRAFQEFTAR